MVAIDYKELISRASFGYAYHRLILDDKNRPVDYEFIEVNKSFEDLTGLKSERITGKRITEVFPGIKNDSFDWINFYGKIVLENESSVFEQYSEILHRWYRVHATPKDGYCFITLFFDITELKETEMILRESTINLGGKIREMNLVAQLSLLVQKKGITLPEVFRETVMNIPRAFQHPESVSAVIKYRDEIYSAGDPGNAMLSLYAGISVNGVHCGYIEVYHTGDNPVPDGKEFTNGEQELLNTLARYLEQFAGKEEAGRQLYLSHEKFRQYINHAPGSIFIVNTAGRYVGVNPAACELLGYSEQELLQLSISDIILPEMKEYGIAVFSQLSSTGSSQNEIMLQKKDGDGVWVSIDAVSLPDGNFMAFCSDISITKKFQNELIKSVMLNQALIDTIPAPIYYKDTSGKYLGMNKAFAAFFGKTKENITGKTVEQILPGELTHIYVNMDKELLENPGIQVYEAPLIDFENTLHDVVFHKAVFRDIDGNPEGIIGVILDVTERKKTEKELELYFRAIQSVDQPLLISDNKGNVIKVNNAFLNMYGYSLEDVTGKNPNVLNPGKDVYLNFGYTEEEYNNLFSSLWKSITNPDIGTWEDIVINKKKDGSLVWVKLLVNTVYNEYHLPVNYIALPVDISGTLQRETMTKVQLYQTIAALAELRDNETGNHMRRVGIFAKLLAQEYNMPEKYCNDLEIFAPLHDIGKVGILDSLLLAERKLTTEEFEIMKTHTTLGFNIVKGKKELEMVASITIAHHEWYNGTGYPRGLEGANIPLSARITAIADVYDALRSKRPYKGEWSHEGAKNYIINSSGAQFDPELTAIFLEISGRFEIIYNELKD